MFLLSQLLDVEEEKMENDLFLTIQESDPDGWNMAVEEIDKTTDKLRLKKVMLKKNVL